MDKSGGEAGRFAHLQGPLLLFLVLLVPIVLSNHPAGTILGGLVVVIIFFLPGYLLLSFLSKLPNGLLALLSPVFGIASITTAYDIFARASLAAYFPYLVVILSLAGMVLFFRAKPAPTMTRWSREGYETVIAGGIVALSIAPLYWRSGRFSGSEFVFYGPAGQDHLYHLTLLQRLLYHVPPDNFIISGLRAPVYHYFADLTLALILRAQNALHLGATDLFDLYYRCYPMLLYFLLGALAYRAGRQLLGSARGGVLSVLLLLGAGGLGWFFGALQTAAHASHLAVVRASLFSDWTSWDGIDSILPLVHRPAHYHSLLICLAALNVLLRPERSRRDWIVAGLLFGLMAGFNFTLAATFGIAAAIGSVAFLVQRRADEARDLAWLAAFIFVGSLPVTSAMLSSGFHNNAPGFPFSGPNLQFSNATWGVFLAKFTPAAFVPWASLILFPIVAYGIKLFGVRPMARLNLGPERYRSIAMVFAVAFTISFVVGTFFPYQAFGGVGIIFLQPTLWILGLFSLHPINDWLERHRGGWGPVALWGMLGLTSLQALAAFNFSHKLTFDQETVRAFQDIRSAAAPDDVVAYLESDVKATPIWGHAQESTNFAVTAMTGLDGYFSSAAYSRFFAVPSLHGSSPEEVLEQANRLYERRRDDIGSFVQGNIDADAFARLQRDQVQWIVVPANALQSLPSTPSLSRKTREIAVYRLSR